MKFALAALDRGPTRLVAQSRLFRTPFVPAGEGDDVINGVAQLETDLSPAALLAHLNRIEADFDRSRGTRWGARTLDLDILTMGDLVLPDRETFCLWQQMDRADQRQRTPGELILPHPRLQDRGFVLVPMAELAAGWRHPILGLSTAEMLAALPAEEVATIRPIAE